MIDDKVLDEVRAMQKANPGLSYDQAWNAVENRRRAIPGDLGAAARAMQASHPGLDFEQSWDLVEAEALPFLKKNLTVGQALVLARKEKPKPWDGAPTQDFEEWLDGATKRQKERSSQCGGDRGALAERDEAAYPRQCRNLRGVMHCAGDHGGHSRSGSRG